MKKHILTLVIILGCLLVIPDISHAQKRYKHMKRGKTEANITNAEHQISNVPVNEPVLPSAVTSPVTESFTSAPEVNLNETETASATTEDTRRQNKSAIRNTVESLVIGGISDISYTDLSRSFLQKLKDKHVNGKIAGPQDTHKAQLERWLTIMIVLYAVGFLFLILAIVFEVTGIWPAAIISWVLFALCWMAATIVLILGLVGVM